MRNDYEIHGDTTVIYLDRKDGTRLECLIDTDDLDRVTALPTSWWADKSSDGNGFYASGEIRKDGKRIKVRLHRFLVGASDNEDVDHKNHNKLDNRKTNIRKVTHAENHQNREKAQSNSHTGIRGVGWHKHSQKYFARIKVNRKSISLGYFDDIKEAEEAIVEARKKYMPYSER